MPVFLYPLEWILVFIRVTLVSCVGGSCQVNWLLWDTSGTPGDYSIITGQS